MIRAALALVAGTVPRLIVLAVAVASIVTLWGMGAPACGVALLVQVVWAPSFLLVYLAIRTIADIAGVLRIEEAPRD